MRPILLLLPLLLLAACKPPEKPADIATSAEAASAEAAVSVDESSAS